MESPVRVVALRVGGREDGEDGMPAPPNEQSLSQKYLGCYEIGFEY
jgi:hypothetical protein